MNDFSITQGTDITLGISVNENGVLKDLTGANVAFVMYHDLEKIVKTMPAEVFIINGKINVNLSRADTRDADPGYWPFEVPLVDNDNLKGIVASGTIHLLASKASRWPEYPVV